MIMCLCACVFLGVGGFVCHIPHHHNVDTIIELNVGVFLLKNNLKLSIGRDDNFQRW